MDKKSIIEFGKEVIQLQSESINSIAKYIDENFEKAIQIILKSTGRVVVTGIGKSAIIANKIVATLNSTGTPSIFMHAADAIHGDLGNVQQGDIVLCLSKSGNTDEIKSLVSNINSLGNKIISICGNPSSYLAPNSSSLILPMNPTLFPNWARPTIELATEPPDTVSSIFKLEINFLNSFSSTNFIVLLVKEFCLRKFSSILQITSTIAFPIPKIFIHFMLL